MPNLILLDVCLPDYFQGYDGTVYAVPVDGTTTANDLKDLLYDDWNSTFSDMDITTDEFKKMVDIFIEDVENKDVPIFPDLEVADENDDESVYAYVGLQRN